MMDEVHKVDNSKSDVTRAVELESGVAQSQSKGILGAVGVSKNVL
jgi:hypothetical protein